MTQVIETPRTVAPGRREKQHRPNRKARIALLGCGRVGAEAARAILDSRERFARTHEIDLQLDRILVRDRARDRGIDPAFLTTAFQEVLDGNPDVVVELLGGIEPAATYIIAALKRGISVVTANKSLIARHGERLRTIAAENGSTLAYEACVGAAIPLIASLRQLAGDEIRSIRAVINGTCNFVLGRIASGDVTFDQALVEAIDLGLAEPDPTADISGLDSAEKLCVLAAEIGCVGVSPQDVKTIGIEELAPADFKFARQLGLVIKQVAELESTETGVTLRVGPTLVPRSHPLAQTHGEDNAVLVESDYGGPLLLRGRGAGPRATASALLGDLLRVADACNTAVPFNQLAQTAVTANVEPRRYLLCLRGACVALTPEAILKVFESHGVERTQIACTTDSVHVYTEPHYPERIFALGKSLSDRLACCVVVIPGFPESGPLTENAMDRIQ